MEEIWKPIPNFKGYEISNTGQIRSYHSDGSGFRKLLDEPHILKPGNNRGYYMVTLVRNQVKHSFTVHRLVLETFIGNKPKGKQARHLNGNKRDNRIENLQWGTAKENANDKTIHGTKAKGEKINTNKLTKTQITEIREQFNSGRSANSIAKIYSIHIRTVYKIINKETWAWL